MIKNILLLLIVATMFTAQASTWKEVLQRIVLQDPSVRESLANEGIAGSVLEQAEATKWPVISATANQRLATTASDADYTLRPGVKAQWTLYDFGKNDALVAEKTKKLDYFAFKTEETAEELINELTGYYLEALKSKMSLDITKKSLIRHQKVVKQVRTIVQYDKGRRSELTQATSRMLKAQEDITLYRRSLKLSLMRLARYVRPALKESDLKDPFSDISIKKLITQYPLTQNKLRHHPSYLAQKNEMASIEAERLSAEKSRWPSFDIVGQASQNESSVFLNMNVDLFNPKSSAHIQEKAFQVAAAEARLSNLQKNLEERAQLASISMNEDKMRVSLAKRQITELKQVAADYQDQFFIAKRSLLDVLNTYRELSSMELVSVNAAYDLMKGKLDYLSSVGGLRVWAGLDNQRKSLSGDLVISSHAHSDKLHKPTRQKSDSHKSDASIQNFWGGAEGKSFESKESAVKESITLSSFESQEEQDQSVQHFEWSPQPSIQLMFLDDL